MDLICTIVRTGVALKGSDGGICPNGNGLPVNRAVTVVGLEAMHGLDSKDSHSAQ